MSALSSYSAVTPPPLSPDNRPRTTDNGHSSPDTPFPRSANSDTATLLPPAPLPNVTKCGAPKPPPSTQLPPPQNLKNDQIAQPVTPSPHSPTSPSPNAFTLTPLHDKAIFLLLRGHSDASIAKSLSISRMTLYRWRSCNPLFQAALNRKRQELWQSDLENLRGLLSRSLRILKKHMRSKDPALQLKAATAMLSHAAPTDLAPPLLPTEPDDIVDMHVRHLR